MLTTWATAIDYAERNVGGDPDPKDVTDRALESLKQQLMGDGLHNQIQLSALFGEYPGPKLTIAYPAGGISVETASEMLGTDGEAERAALRDEIARAEQDNDCGDEETPPTPPPRAGPRTAGGPIASRRGQ